MKLIAVVAIAFGVAAAQTEMPEQAKRGMEAFLNTSKGTACGTCHSLAGKGMEVGPDLTRLSRVPPRGFVAAIKSTVTQYVQMVELKDGSPFPGIQKDKQWWDLSKRPPELRQGQVEKTSPNSKWTHPPANTDYSNRELADIIAYVKWVGYKSVVAIEPEELE